MKEAHKVEKDHTHNTEKVVTPDEETSKTKKVDSSEQDLTPVNHENDDPV